MDKYTDQEARIRLTDNERRMIDELVAQSAMKTGYPFRRFVAAYKEKLKATNYAHESDEVAEALANARIKNDVSAVIPLRNNSDRIVSVLEAMLKGSEKELSLEQAMKIAVECVEK